MPINKIDKQQSLGLDQQESEKEYDISKNYL